MSPFEVVFTTQPPGTEPYAWQEPQSAAALESAGSGDGLRWTVSLGPPFLRLNANNTSGLVFRVQAAAILQTWIDYDRLMLMRFLQSIPVLTGITRRQINSLEGLTTGIWHFWSRQPGANIAHLCQTATPLLTNLGAQLQWQNDQAAYLLIPPLAWIDEQGLLDEMGRGLLGGLRQTHSSGADPADGLSGSD